MLCVWQMKNLLITCFLVVLSVLAFGNDWHNAYECISRSYHFLQIFFGPLGDVSHLIRAKDTLGLISGGDLLGDLEGKGIIKFLITRPNHPTKSSMVVLPSFLTS